MGWGRTLEQFVQDTRQDLNSRFGDPLFTSMPDYYTTVPISHVDLCDEQTLIIGAEITWLEAGDTIEVDFDGVERTVQSVTPWPPDADYQACAIDPPLDKKPLRITLIAKWGNGVSPLDASLQAGSPALNLTEDGGPAGSAIDIQGYMSGDFDGDGLRDIPVINFE
jgi:hypothetical protein